MNTERLETMNRALGCCMVLASYGSKWEISTYEHPLFRATDHKSVTGDTITEVVDKAWTIYQAWRKAEENKLKEAI